MSDQAQMLRDRVEEGRQAQQSKMKIITITSGKGGVGKSNFTTNIAMALAKYGKHPIILDADFGLANVEIIYGQRPKYNLTHLINHTCQTKDLLTSTPYGVSFISGGSGVKDMLFLDHGQIDYIGDALGQLETMTDILLVDTGAGINDIILKFSGMADEVYLIVTPEPASITDAYALIKTVTKDFNLDLKVKVVINKASDKQEAHQVFNKINHVSQQFLGIQLHYAGYVPYDTKLFEAVKHQVPVMAYDENCQASAAYQAIARSMLALPQPDKAPWRTRFKSIFGRRN